MEEFPVTERIVRRNLLAFAGLERKVEGEEREFSKILDDRIRHKFVSAHDLRNILAENGEKVEKDRRFKVRAKALEGNHLYADYFPSSEEVVADLNAKQELIEQELRQRVVGNKSQV